MDDFGGERMGTGICDKWKWLGYDPESHSEFFNNQHGQSYVTLYKAGSGELQYFERLTGWYQTEKPVTVSHRRKHVLLSQLVDQGQFFNATVEVSCFKEYNGVVANCCRCYTLRSLILLSRSM